MDTEVLVSFGTVGASADVSFLEGLPRAHSRQRDGDRRGRWMRENRRGAFTSEHIINGTEVHVREEYSLDGRHRFYVMTASERIRDVAQFIQFTGLAFS